MARALRLWESGGVLHLDTRAHSGAPIFASDEDRAFVFATAAEVFADLGIVCLAAAALINHYHFLCRCVGPPGPAMLRVNTTLARRVRLRGGGPGAVFQGRFFSGLCTDEASLLLRLAYVIANPVHHRVVPTIDALRTHRWSTLGETLGLREAKLTDPAATLALLHDDPAVARVELIDLLEARARVWAARTGDLAEVEPPETTTVDLPRAACEELGVPRTLRTVSGPVMPKIASAESMHARLVALRAEGWFPGHLLIEVCAALGADPGAVLAGRRDVRTSAARAIVCHLACDVIRWKVKDVAAAVGTSTPAACQARRRGAAIVAELGLRAADLVDASRERARRRA
jgi:hypothetical protein